MRVSPLRIGTLKRLMAGHPYFDGWSVDQIRPIEPFANLVDVEPDAELIALEDLSPFDFFLLQGRLRLRSTTAQERTIDASDVDAGFPIAHLRPSHYSVTAETPAQLLRIEASKLRRQAQPENARFRLPEEVLGGTWQNHPMLVDLMRQVRAGTLEIPAVPSIANRVRRAIANEDYDVATVATIISADPSIAARLIKIANSAVFGGQKPCDVLRDAIVRLGMARTQNVVFTLATKVLFQARAPHIRDRLLDIWRHAIEIASLCAVLAKLTPDLGADKGLLVGLLHDIGKVPILKLAERFEDLEKTPGILDETLNAYGGYVGSSVLEHWSFPDEFADAATNQAAWFRQHDGGADFTDLVVIAHLHSLVKRREFHKLPRIDETPAFQKLAAGRLSPQLSLSVLDEAQREIEELRALLS